MTYAPGASADGDAIVRAVDGLGYRARVLAPGEEPPAAPAATPASRPPDVAEAFDRAAREGRLVLFDCHADWCAPCRRMEEETFPDPRVRGVLDARFVVVSVNVEESPDAARYFGTEGLPDI